MKGVALNNRKLRAFRKDPVYETVMTDLYLIGGISKEALVQLIGHEPQPTLVCPVAGAEEPEEVEAEAV